MTDQINYASLTKAELVAAIEAADGETLAKIDADLNREGWLKSGVLRNRIAERRANLTG